MSRSIGIVKASIQNKIGFALWSVTPVSVKGMLYLRHRAKIMSRTSIISK